MKIAVPQLLFLILFTGCAKYQYFTIESHLAKDEKNIFFHSNDTLKISYAFTQKGAINITVENYSDELLYIDWEKSAIIVEGNSLPVLRSKLKVSGEATTIDLFDSGIASTDFDGYIDQETSKSAIPPKSRITKIINHLPISFMDTIETNSFEKITINNVATKKYKFTSQDSINYFRTYFFIGNTNQQQFIYDHDFWIGEIVETSSSSLPTSNNQFRKETATATGTAMVGLGAGALIVLAAATAIEEE